MHSGWFPLRAVDEASMFAWHCYDVGGWWRVAVNRIMCFSIVCCIVRALSET